MNLLKELLFWWMLIENVLLVISSKYRKETIEYLERLEKRRKERNIC